MNLGSCVTAALDQADCVKSGVSPWLRLLPAVRPRLQRRIKTEKLMDLPVPLKFVSAIWIDDGPRVLFSLDSNQVITAVWVHWNSTKVFRILGEAF